MYTVVVCPECRTGVWFVKNQPDRTSCIHCGHTRKFKRFQHCHTTDDSEEARIAVAEVRAKINDQMDLFEETYEAGVLHDDPDSFFDTESEAGAYFDEKVEQLHSNNGASSRSEQDIIRDGIRTQDYPSREEVVSYASEHSVDSEKTEHVLRKLVNQGKVIETGTGLTFLE